jgi:hypothetical protein
MDEGEKENGEDDSTSEDDWTDSDTADAIQMPVDIERAFRASKWFTRGWTLQELLAPYKVYFVDRDWKTILGGRNTLSRVISEVTSIDGGVLKEWLLRLEHSIAERMSWASQRMCTRGEDVAYCLLGLFNVNMPLLYGEGKHAAFRRLQLEILKDSNDESIFAWRNGGYSSLGFRESIGDILAVSPSDLKIWRTSGLLSLSYGHRDSRIIRRTEGWHSKLFSTFPQNLELGEQEAWRRILIISLSLCAAGIKATPMTTA